MNNFLFFDMETLANPEAIKTLPDPMPPANYKDQEKINAYIAEKKAEQISQAALDPDLGMIDAISIQAGYPGEIETRVVGDKEAKTEADLIRWFWSKFVEARGQSVGYNTQGFDFPYLLRRSLALGVYVPMQPALMKYRIEPTIDLMAILYNWGQAKSLKWVSKRYGIKDPLPDSNGSQYALMKADERRKYSANGVYLAVKLYELMVGIYLPSNNIIPRQANAKKAVSRKPRN
jgi:DNA polymerase elongation subunit (family B)